MDSDKNASPSKDTSEEEIKQDVPQAPADALSRTPDELADEAAATRKAEDAELPPVKKVSAFKRVLKKVNVYFLIFFILLAVAGAIAAVNFINSQKEPEVADLATQELTQDTLQQLANSDASVGDVSQTLTIQGNAIIAGQTLMRGDLNVAGNFQSGGTIQGPGLTISGTSNLAEVQANNLQVATNATVQGATSLGELTVSGASSFNGAIVAQQVTVSRLIISGTGILEVPNHISFTGPAPAIAPAGGVLGNGGSASLSGSDTAGTVNVNTGNNPTAGCFARINFRQAFSGQPRVLISPIGNAAGQTQFYVDRNNSGFSICTATPAPNNQQFGFDYFVAG